MFFWGLQRPHSVFNPLGDVGLRTGPTGGSAQMATSPRKEERRRYSHQDCAVLWNGMLGNTFWILCEVRQGSVLSPYLFSIYIDDVIGMLRKSGYGLHIGTLFVGCLIYADDIILLSSSCHGIQKLVDVCMTYGMTWDLCFNPHKTQCITFRGRNPTTFNVELNHSKLDWCNVIKYLGCYFLRDTCRIDLSHLIRKYYGNFNNIMSV